MIKGEEAFVKSTTNNLYKSIQSSIRDSQKSKLSDEALNIYTGKIFAKILKNAASRPQYFS